MTSDHRSSGGAYAAVQYLSSNVSWACDVPGGLTRIEISLWWMDEIVVVNNRFENTNVNILSALDDLNRWSLAADKTEPAD